MKAVFILPTLLALVSAAPKAKPQSFSIGEVEPTGVIIWGKRDRTDSISMGEVTQSVTIDGAESTAVLSWGKRDLPTPSFSIGEVEPTGVISWGKRDDPTNVISMGEVTQSYSIGEVVSTAVISWGKRDVVPTKVPELCQCDEVLCIQSWPESCYCRNSAARMCYEKCGGNIPILQVCDNPVEPVSLDPVGPSLSALPPVPTLACPCPPVACIQVWPQSCYCANAAKKRCYDSCGGPVPTYQVCEPILVDTLGPSTIKTTTKPTLTTKTGPTGTHQPCGGFVPSPKPCPTGEVCIDDPFIKGCGMACDRPGICVPSKLCGGFAAIPCPTGMTCVDNPRDSCDPKKGGADCGGLCVWPH